MNFTQPKPAFSDDRGSITDLIDNDEINAVTVITFTKGAVRANHFHEHTVQWNYVMSGKIRLVTQLPDGPREERILEKGDLALTVETERHALEALEESEVLILTKGPRAGSEYENDTFRLELPLVAARKS